ncbi:hypothetical protein MTsDn5_04280 [Alteromonas gracilis]|uniref:cupin domain-containing protein n=1 Tax=Alteromonas gracilis TaxID=1479524 RepID=UPI0036F3A93D
MKRAFGLATLLPLSLLVSFSATAVIEKPLTTKDKQISAAPGKGVINDVNSHLVSQAVLFNLAEQPKESVTDKLTRQYFHGNESTFVRWDAKKGAKVPLHKHPNEQVTWLLQGKATVFSDGKKYMMKAGDIMVIPANVLHEFHFTEDAIDIDFFVPARQDWIDGTADYIK